jgi:predicted membrane channel-forming protein YqfA (hemolysin III family)
MRLLKTALFVAVGYVAVLPVVAFLELPPRIIALVVLAGAAVLLVGAIRGRYEFNKLGYLVTSHGREQLEYRERSGGVIRSLIIGGELLAKGRVVYIPSETGWNTKMPEWAWGRRDQIIERVKANVGTKDYEFQEMPDA